jgi:hypothetical protein
LATRLVLLQQLKELTSPNNRQQVLLLERQRIQLNRDCQDEPLLLWTLKKLGPS